MVFMVELTYFKPNGKYYASAEYSTQKDALFEIWREVTDFQRQGKLPGLVEGAVEFTTLINVPGHPHSCPHLIPGEPE